MPVIYRAVSTLAAVGLALSLSVSAQAHEDHPTKTAPPAASGQTPAVGPAAPVAQGHENMDMGSPEARMAAGGHAMDEEPPKTLAGRLVNWLGKWHPTVVHFPISLFIIAALLEARAVLFRKPRFSEATRLMVGLGAVSAIAAILLGWMAMGWTYGRYDQLHTAHQTLGTFIALLALGAWWAHERWIKAASRSAGLLYGILLTTTVGAIAVNGFLGGALVRGLDHLNF